MIKGNVDKNVYLIISLRKLKQASLSAILSVIPLTLHSFHLTVLQTVVVFDHSNRRLKKSKVLQMS